MSEPSEAPKSKRQTKGEKFRARMKEMGIEPFWMVACVPVGIGEEAMTEEQEKEFQPHVRHRTHRSAQWQAHQLAKKHGRRFVVLGVQGFALPSDGEDSEGEEKEEGQ